ncbi:hypothetical protein JDO7802_01159 [Jannaschia donghaensis]|uniref:HupE / UreJ protein n=1 Tax=Jannaschia donghaensis TaxID=420998 RepID=A0A0M6YFN4_9RHOB|nr:hypothetical protein JDO7802_01159 [Jannaschia donghaensis]
MLALLSMGLPITAAAHEVQPAVADVRTGGDAVTITLRAAVEPMIAGVNLSEVEDTDDSPLSDRNDALRALSPDELSAALTESWTSISEGIVLRAGDTPLIPTLVSVDVPPVGDVEIRRDSTLTLSARLPDGDDPVVFGFDAALGGLIVRQVSDGSEETYEAFLTNGSLSDPMPRTGVAQQTLAEVAQRYVVSGFVHVIPDGLDHILFVLGLYFFALAWRPMLWQVTSFTIAHTTTLFLATTGAIVVPAEWMWLVETIIAASIVWIGVENLMGGRKETIGWGRIGVVFVFGLVHGLGFASVLSEFGLGEWLIASLAFFTVGLEIGHLTVIAIAFLLMGLPFGHKSFYRSAFVVPGSVIIAAIGAYWVLNRIGWAGDLPYLT